MSQINSASSGTGAPPIEQINGNTGTVIPVIGVVNIIGTDPISTAGAGNTLTITVADASTTQKGVVELATDAEAIASVDTTRAIVPTSLTAKLGSQVLNGVAYGGSSFGAVNWTTPGLTGQVLLGQTGSAPVFGPSPGGGGFTFSVITADQTAAVNNGYICNKGGLLTLTLPASSAVGDIIEVTGMNTDLGWKIAQGASQQIHFGTMDTTSGAGGSLASSKKYDAVRIVCNVTDLEWIVLSDEGNITIV